MAKEVTISGETYMLSDCIKCGVKYTVPIVMWNHQQDNGGFHHCPNGHSQGWGKDSCSAASLRRERDLLKQQMAQRDDEVAMWRATADEQRKQVTAAKGQITKLKKRAKAGTCPCCKRTFSNMASHMKTCHPEFDPEKIVSLDSKRSA